MGFEDLSNAKLWEEGSADLKTLKEHAGQDQREGENKDGLKMGPVCLGVKCPFVGACLSLTSRLSIVSQSGTHTHAPISCAGAAVSCLKLHDTELLTRLNIHQRISA